jgi:hypothetical protein
MIKPILVALFCQLTFCLTAQNPYEQSLTELKSMLNDQTPLSFKKAVFSIENAYYDNQLSEQAFDKAIAFLLNLIEAKSKQPILINYDEKDKDVVTKQSLVFKIMTDTTFMMRGNDTLFSKPYKYDFDDIFARENWSTMFVTKLLATGKGNCHSMPYLYKILCEALHVPCYLSLSPNHIYIKNYSDKLGWYNTELTSASFPIDGWLMASGFIGLEAIQSGIYMDTLSDKQAISMCVFDLGKGFDRKYPDNDGEFVVKCCDLALTYFPKYINALLLKAQTRKRQVDKRLKESGINNIPTSRDKSVLRQQKDVKSLVDEMNSLYKTIHQLGYRMMPEQMYLDWLHSMTKQQDKYNNKAIMDMNKH